MKSLLRIVILIAVLTADLQAQISFTYLTVSDPRTWGKSGPGTIDAATVAMTPAGTFMKYDVTMTFSAGTLSMITPADSLEITYRFSLAAGAVVNDLWLWVGNELSRGLILDRGTASATYENIVKRRRDPAFLLKQYTDNYQLQIYPMAGNGSRTVKFSYVMPLARSGGQWTAPIPAYLFRQSLVPLQSLRVIYYAPSPAHIPSVVNESRYAFAPWTDSLSSGNAWKCDISNEIFKTDNPSVAVPIGDSSAYIITRYAGSQGGIYHVTLDPFAVLSINAVHKKVLFAFDYDSAKTTRTRQDYIDTVKTLLKTHCTEKDSFDVLFNTMEWAGEHWFAADSAGIAQAFSAFADTAIYTFSDLRELFVTAADILKSRGGDGDIMLLAASDKFMKPALADPVLAWLGANLPAKTEIHIVNFQNRNYTNAYINGVIYQNNEYFYAGIKKLTGGTIQTADNAHTDPLGEAMRALRGSLNSLDLQVRFANGFSYSQFPYGILPFQGVLTSQLVGQIGKYSGSGNMTLEVGGFYRDEPYHTTIAVPDSAIIQADSVMRAVWTGRSITDVEWTGYTTADMKQAIIDACLKERVVCRYTALLALEPGDTLAKTLNDQGSGPVVMGAKEQTVPTHHSIAQAYPNPFNPSTTLRVQLPEGVRAQDVTLRIYNTLGQLVRTFDPAGLTSTAYKEFIWDATDNGGRSVASGMYVFVVSTPNARHTVKLMLLK